jgi:Na+:H+ antiporter, NhaA family
MSGDSGSWSGVLPPVKSQAPVELSDPVTCRMHQDFTRLRKGQTVGEALEWLRRNPPPGRVIYFYVVDDDDRLQGVVPTRRLVLSAPTTPVTDIMVRKTLTLPASATVLDACEFFILHRLLAFPIVDEANRLVGVVDIDLYTNELRQLDRASALDRLVAPLVRFFEIESAGGILLLGCTVVALVLANSPVAGAVADFWHAPVALKIGGFALNESLLHVINDGLMTLFFFVVGLEIKREIVTGELSDFRKALLPLVAALGGMLVPAAFFLVIVAGRPGLHGWGIPMATDIAFVVGFLTLFGARVPTGLKILLLTLAIADDIGAILVIAVAYSTDIHVSYLLLDVLGFGLVLLLRWLGARNVGIYTVVGVGIWLAFFESGIHPTVAGVLLGLLTPARPSLGGRMKLDVIADLFARFRGAQRGLPYALPEAISPVERLEHALHPWVAFAIMPLFALANAGVDIGEGGLKTPIALGIAAGLILGKPLGIVLFSWASVRLRLCRLPEGISWRIMLGAGFLCGIGFTMSLFIASLAYETDEVLLAQAKIGVLAGSAVSAAIGCLILWMFLPRKAESDA